jgi:hypothetical protein
MTKIVGSGYSATGLSFRLWRSNLAEVAARAIDERSLFPLRNGSGGEIGSSQPFCQSVSL